MRIMYVSCAVDGRTRGEGQNNCAESAEWEPSYGNVVLDSVQGSLSVSVTEILKLLKGPLFRIECFSGR